MGIRFRCHHCEHELNLKEFQAGRRARCPACSGRFRVPASSANFSVPLNESEDELASAGTSVGTAIARSTTFNLKPSSTDPEINSVVSGRHVQSRAEAGSADLLRLPLAIMEAPQAIWYVRPPSGGQYGPADGHVFFQWMQDKRVSPDSLVWRDGWPQWVLAGEAFEEFFGSAWRIASPHDSVDSSTQSGASDLDSPQAVTGQPNELTVSAFGQNLDETQANTNSIARARRKKQQMTYGIMIAALAVLALVLVGVLLSVILK